MMEKSQVQTAFNKLVYTITASSVGTIIEWYDFYIFAGLATIISSRFFPKENPTAAFLATLATFSAGFVVRPFGALIFGRIGDMIGRKYTFMVTLILMGGSTFFIGLVPEYRSIGFWSPLIVLLLRLLQGLAIGGEYGGAATFVAEHSPVNQRGFWTSWIQSTTTLGFVISLGIILITKSSLKSEDWEAWGWRIPFLVSAIMVVLSVYIRKNMEESPLFALAKAEGRTSKNPLKESFGNKANLKWVLLALFGLTMGLGVVGYSTSFYSQSFMLKIMNMNYEQANRIVIIAGLLSIPVFIFFGWLSDKIGRKFILLSGLLVGILFFKPIFGMMYQTANLKNRIEIPNKMQVQTDLEWTQNHKNLTETRTTIHEYQDGTQLSEVQIQKVNPKPIRNEQQEELKQKPEITHSIKVNPKNEWLIIFLVFLLCSTHALAYAPVAAYLVEMFPIQIRYTSLSLPYHVGFGIFGGMSLVISTYLIEKAKLNQTSEYYLQGLNYAVIMMIISLIIGLIYLKDHRESQNQEEKLKRNPQKTKSKSPIHSLQPNASELNTNLSKWTQNLNLLKRILGPVWILLGLAAAYFGIFILGIPKLLSGKQDDLIFGIIVLFLITPLATIGLILFGKYALQGEYDDLNTIDSKMV